MKKISTFLVALLFISFGMANAQSITPNTNLDLVPTIVKPENNSKALTMITQSSAQTITTGNSVSCNSGGIHTDNWYYRCFDLAANHGITGIWYVYKVDIAIEQATGAATQPIKIQLYSASTTNLTTATLTLIQEQTFNLTNPTTAAVVTFTFTTPVTIPAGTKLAVAFFTPNGTTGGNSCFIGSNTAAETGPSYLKAPDCSVNVPTTCAAIGFPGMHIVMNVWGDVTTDINEIGGNQINVFPSPTKGIINVENISNSNILVTNVLGEVVASKENVNGSTSFDLSNNAKGVYMIQIISDNNVITKRIIVD